MHPIIESQHVFVEARSILQGSGYVMSTTSPFYLGRVLTFKDNDGYLSSMANNAWPVVTVPGYRILIQFAGSLLNGRRLQLTSPDASEIKRELGNMADFYYQERIAAHAGYHKKFLL